MRLRLFHRPESNHPDRILRCVAAHPEIGPGSRILLVGNCDDRIIRGLIELGCLVTVGRDCEADVEQLQAEFPEADCHVAVAVRNQFDPEIAGFDLVAVFPGAEPFQSNLLTPHAMLATAALIGCLRPGGVYLMLPGEPSCSAGFRHSTRCCVQHLSSLVAAARQFDAVLRCNSSRAPLSETVSVTTPGLPLEIDDWASIASHAARGYQDSVCCELAARGLPAA